MNFFTSDLHWYHKRICEMSNRPWQTLERMHRGLVDRWNAKVSHEDTVYNLGDWSFAGRGHTLMVTSQLKGRIIHLCGNHDSRTKMAVRPGLDVLLADRIADLTIGKQRLVLCHYPLLTWEGAHRDTWMLHGHSHGSLDKRFNGSTTRIDVGVDSEHTNYAPLSFDEIAAIMARRKYEAVDHHGKRDFHVEP